jgi:cyclohexanone monooxygenase
MGSIQHPDFDAIVIGAGVGGLRTLHELQKLKLSAKCFERGSNVGGTWYWNRYPGARTDSEAWVYICNVSKELNDDWNWSERLPSQGEVLSYLDHFADRFNLRKDIEFHTSVSKAHFDCQTKLWTVTDFAGKSCTASYLITAVGPLSEARKPDFACFDQFKGEWHQTSSWPKTTVKFTGKRVAVIGTGATGVQVIPIVAHEADHVTVFQRTPNYVIPGRNYHIPPQKLKEVRRDYDQIWQQARGQVFGMAMPAAGRTVKDVKDHAHHLRILDQGWEAGGFHFVFTTFDDILVDQKSNEVMSEFVRNKIRTMVNDEKTAELLCPRYPFLAKRPPLGHFYYEAFNRSNVQLVDVGGNNGIQAFTEKGLRTENGNEYEFDMVIFAIGFDAATGALAEIEIRGENDVALKEVWAKELETHLGITVTGFPNMFMVTGPQSPFANIPIIIDNTATWIGKAITHLQQENKTSLEPTKKAEKAWANQVNGVFNMTLIAGSSVETRSWYVGANVPGKPQNVLFYFGGVGAYFDECEKEAAAGFPSYVKA